MENLILKRSLGTLITGANAHICIGDLKTFVIITNEKSTCYVLEDGLKELISFPDADGNATADIVGCQYMPDEDAICVALVSGDIYMIYLEPVMMEWMGSVDNGILSMAFSPDSDLVVFVTGDGKILEMTKTFDTITEVPIELDEFGDAVPVSVGWGKKETQFHGSVGKEAAKEKVQASISPNDDNLPRLSWRGDGEYFCCSIRQKDRRVIRVYNREGALQSTSETVPGLEHALSWRPSGNLIASSQLTHKQDIVFFERNGLRHGEFKLFKTGIVRELYWNADSTILAVQLDTETGSCIQLWTSKNYHWYCKMELPFNFTTFMWHPELAMVAYGYSNDMFTEYEFSWCVDAYKDHVAVVDATSILLTPFSKGNIPPPMSFQKIQLDFVPLNICMEADKIAILNWDSVHVFSLETLGSLEKYPSHGVYQVCFTDSGLLGIKQKQLMNMETCAITEQSDRVALLKYSNNALCLESKDGHILNKAVKFPEFCVKVEALQDGRWLGLSHRNRLYCQDQLLCDEATSFMVHKGFIIFTTLSCKVEFMNLQLEILPEYMRAIERGAWIVTATDINLIFQLPRGNLETIAPRALVLTHIKDKLDSHEFRDAFLMARKHRIDLNILVDHNRDLIIQNMDEFCQQIKKVDYLNLFISSLKDDSLCDILCASLEKLDSTYISCILTTDAKRSPPALEDAMRRILKLRDTSSEAAEAALNYLIFLADVDQLYDVALGMYDFPLVLLVAQHSKKDPREYLEFLTGLQALEKYYQRFKIDEHLGRKVSALKNLSLANRFNEFLSFMQANTLYEEAIDLFEQGTTEFNTILLSFADYKSTMAPGEAALLYETAGDYENAFEYYIQAGCWKQALYIAYKTKKSSSEIEAAGDSLLTTLLDTHAYKDAASVCREFLKNPSKALECLISGYFWRDAQYLIAQHSLDAKILENAIQSRAQDIKQQLSTINENFKQHETRLQHVREKKTMVHIPLDDSIEMFSDTASMVTLTTLSTRSNMSSRTARTSKTRRKMARKRAAGLDPAFEDEYLIDCMTKIIKEFNSINDELVQLCDVLFTMNISLVKELKGLLKTLRETIVARVPTVYPENPPTVNPIN